VNISKRERNMVIAMVFVVVIAVAMVMGGGGKSRSGKKMLPLREAQDELIKATQQLKQMNADQDAMEPRVEQGSFNQTPDLLAPQVVRDLQSIADKVNVHLSEIKPASKPTQVKGVNAIKVSMEVRFHSAFQPNVVKFLYYVEASTSKMAVDKLNITSTDSRLKTVDVTAQISVYTRALPGGNASQTGDVSYVYTTTRNG
jgi:hypothetical protein